MTTDVIKDNCFNVSMKEKEKKKTFQCKRCLKSNFSQDLKKINIKIDNYTYYIHGYMGASDWEEVGETGETLSLEIYSCKYCGEIHKDMYSFKHTDDEIDNEEIFNISINDLYYTYFKDKIKNKDIIEALKILSVNIGVSKITSLFLIRRMLEIVLIDKFKLQGVNNLFNLESKVDFIKEYDIFLKTWRNNIYKKIIKGEKITNLLDLLKYKNTLDEDSKVKELKKIKKNFDFLEHLRLNIDNIINNKTFEDWQKAGQINDFFEANYLNLSENDIEILDDFRELGNLAVHDTSEKLDKINIIDVYQRMIHLLCSFYKITHPTEVDYKNSFYNSHISTKKTKTYENFILLYLYIEDPGDNIIKKIKDKDYNEELIFKLFNQNINNKNHNFQHHHKSLDEFYNWYEKQISNKKIKMTIMAEKIYNIAKEQIKTY